MHYTVHYTVHYIVHYIVHYTVHYVAKVEPADNPPRAPSHFGPRVVATRRWAHHRFSLWEVILMQRLLPRLNHRDGLHVAGDYTNGYGHEDALKSGLDAACRVGIAAKAKALLHSDGFATPDLNTAWASNVIRGICPFDAPRPPHVRQLSSWVPPAA